MQLLLLYGIASTKPQPAIDGELEDGPDTESGVVLWCH